jgi:sodium transport system ATP-binding protein
MIVVDKLAKNFGKVRALEDVSFTASDGRITGLLGSNGAGKSTTLRIVSTVLRPDSGSIVVDGIDGRQEPLKVRVGLGVLPHASGIYPQLTARENIRYYGDLHGLAPDVIDRRTSEWSERLEMGDFLDRPTRGFSHGQKLKVALARSLVHAPRNIILDEPTSGLDVQSTRALRDVIKSLKAAGCCVVFSSHVMQEVAALCDDIVIIARGRVVASGNPEEILAATGALTLEDAFVKASGSTPTQ